MALLSCTETQLCYVPRICQGVNFSAVLNTVMLLCARLQGRGGCLISNSVYMHAAIGPFNKSDYVRSLPKVGAKSAFPDMKFTVRVCMLNTFLVSFGSWGFFSSSTYIWLCSLRPLINFVVCIAASATLGCGLSNSMLIKNHTETWCADVGALSRPQQPTASVVLCPDQWHHDKRLGRKRPVLPGHQQAH